MVQRIGPERCRPARADPLTCPDNRERMSPEEGPRVAWSFKAKGSTVSVIKAEDIAFVRFKAPDLAEMRTFLEEFGLVCFEHQGKLYGRGTDGAPFAHVTEQGSPAFAGLGIRAGSRADLDTLAERDGVSVQTADTPGGGWFVRLHDPDGNVVDVVAEQSWSSPDALPADTPINSASERRRLRSSVRFPPGPSHVYRLGHVVLNVGDFAVTRIASA